MPRTPDSFTTVDWLTRSVTELAAVTDLRRVADAHAGYFCVTRMDPAPRRTHTEYWASASWPPDVRVTAKAATPERAARDALAMLRDQGAI